VELWKWKADMRDASSVHRRKGKKSEKLIIKIKRRGKEERERREEPSGFPHRVSSPPPLSLCPVSCAHPASARVHPPASPPEP